MGEAARKINFMINSEVADELERLVPPGQRSKLVNEALRKELLSFKRRQLTDRLMSLREEGPKYTTKELVTAVREDRKRH